MKDKDKNEITLDESFKALNKIVDHLSRKSEAIEPPNPPDFEKICKEYLNFDSWSLKEGLNLLCRCHPKKNGWDHGVGRLWNLAERSIGETLIVINPNISTITSYGRCTKLKVRPNDLIRWAKSKNIKIPCEIEMLEQHSEKFLSPTEIASRERTYGKKERRTAIEELIDKAKNRAEHAGLKWDTKALEVTKQELYDVFYAINSSMKPVSIATFKDDLDNLRIRFRKGIKKSPENILTILFRSELE